MTDTAAALRRPLDRSMLTRSGKGMTAVDHTGVVQRLLDDVGPYTFAIVDVLRETLPDYQGRSKSWPGGLMVTGCLATLTVEVDGRTVSITEAGGVENAQMIDGDGERVKHAASDAIKRCAMRLGLGLEVWAQRDTTGPADATVGTSRDEAVRAAGDLGARGVATLMSHHGWTWDELDESGRQQVVAMLLDDQWRDWIADNTPSEDREVTS